MSPSPALPWEVIERVIDHSADSTKTLYGFTLTCRDLLPRSTILLFGRVKLKKRVRLFDLCALLQLRPHLQPYVQSVSINAHEFSPHPLLRMLSNLSEIELTDIWDTGRPLTFHASVLAQFRELGQHVRTLSLNCLQFSSLSAFSHLLLSLPRIESLSCAYLSVKNDRALPELVTRRLSERLHLRTLTVLVRPSTRREGGTDDTVVLGFLREAAKRNLAALIYLCSTYERVRKSAEKILLASPSGWAQLTSFVLKLTDQTSSTKSGRGNPGLEHAIQTLRDFRPPKLQEVTVVFSVLSFRHFFAEFLARTPELCAELDKTLAAFPQPTLSLSYHHHPINTRQNHLWMHMLGRLFPALEERGALTIKARYSGFAGHDDAIRTPIVISADSRWAATGSCDGTIIVWDLESGCIAQEWFAEDTGVDSLAFSPDSRYLMSTSSREAAIEGEWATVWDLHQGGRRIGSLKGEGGRKPSFPDEHLCRNCAWSPDGTWIAAGAPAGSTVHVWETTTFQLLYTWKGSELLAFSADGRWVATTALEERSKPDPNQSTTVWVWVVQSGELHRSLQGHADGVCAAAFSPTSTRIATGSLDSTIRIWDTQTGEPLLVLREQARRQVDTVVFSGDGRMVLSHSSALSEWYDPSDNLSHNLSEDNIDPAPFPEGDIPHDDGRDGAVKVWDASNGALLASFNSETHSRHTETPRSACFSPCGSYVASVSDDKGALLWRTSDSSCIAEVSCGGAPVTRVAISPDGRVLCCGTLVGTVFFRRMHDLISASQG